MSSKPRIFIGSTYKVKKERDPDYLYEALKSWADPVVWGDDVFKLSETTIECLEAEFRKCDACVFFLTKDDPQVGPGSTTQHSAPENVQNESAEPSGETYAIFRPRDNILFEVGLSMGIIGRKNTILLMDEDVEHIKMPSDLLGITYATYNPKAKDRENEFKKVSDKMKSNYVPTNSKYKLPATKQNLLEEINGQIMSPIQEINQSIKGLIEKINDSTMKDIAVLSGAEQSGIVNIFPNRYSNIAGKSMKDCIQKEIHRAKKECSQISIMGISLGDYFLDRGMMNYEFMELMASLIDDAKKKVEHGQPSKDHVRIRALISDPSCMSLRDRARWEVAPVFYKKTGILIDYMKAENLKAYVNSTTFIETDGVARITKQFTESMKDCFQVRYYSQAPTCFLFLTDRYAFVENYTYASRGSSAPIIQFEKDSSKTYSLYSKHFENIWSIAKDIESYQPLELIEAVEPHGGATKNGKKT